MISLDHFDNPHLTTHSRDMQPRAWQRIIRTRTAVLLLHMALAASALLWAQAF